MRILIVDDSSTMRRLVRRALRGAGFGKATVEEAADGAEALAALEGASFDVILSDMNMPNMTGMEFLEQLKERPKPERVVMITSEAGTPVEDALLEGGAAACIGKPFTPEQLKLAIEQATSTS